jgi:hypothetical protein
MPSATELIGPGGLGLLRASDLPASMKQFTVTLVAVEHNEQLKSPLVATVEEEILPGVTAIGLNKTNIRSLVEYLGDDYSKWAGASVTFAKVPQNNPTTGTTGWGIRVVEASFPQVKRK